MLTAAAASRITSTFSGLAPQHHKQPFPWCSQIPKGELSNNLNATCYRPSVLGHAWHGEELRVANTPQESCLTGEGATVPFVHLCPPWGPVSARAMPSTPGWETLVRAGDGHGLSLLLTSQAFLWLTDLLVAASSCSPVLAQCVRDSKDLSSRQFWGCFGG